MGTVLRIPTYTYYDNDSLNRQSSVMFIMDDTLSSKAKQWNTQYGESGIIQEWTGADITDIPAKVNGFLGFPLLSKKSAEPVIPIADDSTWPNNFKPYTSDVLNRLYVSYKIHTGMTNTVPSSLYNPGTNVVMTTTLNSTVAGNVDGRDSSGVYNFTLGQYYSYFATTTFPSGSQIRYTLQYIIFPEDWLQGREFNPAYGTGGEHSLERSYSITVHVDTTPDGTKSKITRVWLTANQSDQYYSIYALVKNMPSIGPDAQELDTNNPYGEGGSATVGGGDGAYGDIDATDPAEIPNLPSISAADLGFITMYNPTAAQLKSLSDFMWSGAFDLATYKKLFSDPMQSIIGLAIVPVAPSVAGSKNVMFGTIDSGITMNYLSTNYVQHDCGSVSIDKYVGCFMDNDPYTKISLYLPFIGIRQLSADDLIGGSIHVVYNIDVLTGACACFVEHSTRGVLYSYNGSCITNVPLTAVNFSGAIQNAVTAIGSAVGMAAGIATGAAPITAMSIAGMMTSAANTAMNSKPQVQRSGNLGGSAGIMSIMTPYVIIERPNLSVPNKVEKFVGQTSNITMRLSDCSGFTMCDYVHLDGINATSEEILEIESMLKAGVIL